MAEGEEATAIVGCAFEVFDAAEFVEEPDHDFVCALLRYIFDEHFLPNLLFRTHCVKI